MTVRATAALFALLFTALPSALAWAEKAPPLRVAVVVKSQPAHVESERRLLQGLEVGMKWVYGRKLTVVDAAAAPDVIVDLSYLVLGDPAAGKALLTATIDGRRLHAPVLAGGNEREKHANWQRAGSTLGQDVAVVLKAKATPDGPPAVAEIIAGLAARDAVARAQAASQAARLGAEGEAAIPALLKVLHDDRPLRIVGGLGADTTPAKEAGKALNALGAHAELIAFVRSEASGHARVNALTAVAIGRSPESPDVVLQALDDDSREVRAAAAGLAGAYVGRRSVPKLLEIIEQERKADLRMPALRSLTLMAGEDLGLDAAPWRQWAAGQARR